VNQDTLYVHSKRPVWGMAILAFEGQGSRRYQFQDGQLRTIKLGYYELLHEVADPPEDARAIVASLESSLGVSRARRELVKTSNDGTVKVITLESQIEYFAQTYEGGFRGDTWNTEIRGEGAPRRLKKHRAIAIAEARKSLSEDAVNVLTEGGEADEIGRRAIAIIKSTNITRPSVDVAPLLDLDDEALATFGTLAADLLYGDGAFGDRLERLVLAISGEEPMTWPGATALAALVQADDHVCVRPSTARLQARWVSPMLTIGDSPAGAEYEKIVAMNRTIFSALVKAGQQPRDLMDVTEFSRLTLRPAVRKLITRQPRRS
jgi:hypothetical protein